MVANNSANILISKVASSGVAFSVGIPFTGLTNYSNYRLQFYNVYSQFSGGASGAQVNLTISTNGTAYLTSGYNVATEQFLYGSTTATAAGFTTSFVLPATLINATGTANGFFDIFNMNQSTSVVVNGALNNAANLDQSFTSGYNSSTTPMTALLLTAGIGSGDVFYGTYILYAYP
jgi:hypothetical protein